ncbi:MAG: choice-of-anchor D domain-containing protein, partial [Myxococcota bacterium]|nr:choice-of-anchor D domain-containing protein [Myxococcota bacterium]
ILENGQRETLYFTLFSEGDAAVNIIDMLVKGSMGYEITWLDEETTLAPGDSIDVAVHYEPLSVLDNGEVEIASNASNPEISVILRGSGMYPAISIAPGSVSLSSEHGESVTTDVLVKSVGSAPLELYEYWLMADDFEVSTDIPTTLMPGEETVITVTYHPDNDELTDHGQLWISSNTEVETSLVPLQGNMAPLCLGLGEAWDRGSLAIHSDVNGDIIYTHLGDEGDKDICIDQWYILISEESQDAGVGDPYFDPGGEYPYGSITLEPGDIFHHQYARPDTPTWWCMEQTQYTAPTHRWEFPGARVPQPLLSFMFAQDQQGVWDWMAQNPVVAVGRYNHFIEPETGNNEVRMRIINMGHQATTATIKETVPVAFTASNFSVAPSSTSMLEDGAVTYVFSLELDASILTDPGFHTLYDEVEISYTVAPAGGNCQGRYTGYPPTASWLDNAGETRIADGNPLIFYCE